MTVASSSVRLPSVVLSVLADRCVDLGPGGESALREAGRAAGEAVVGRLGPSPGDATPDQFWEAVGQQFVDLGLGPVRYRLRTPAVAEIRLEEVPEADGVEGEPRRLSGCPFSAGLLSGLLGEVAGEPVAVHEVECRAGGAAACRFLVGSRPRLSSLRERIADGASLRQLLEER